MALKDLLYLCPFCGEDPTTAAGPHVRCPSCGRTFGPAGAGARIRVREGGTGATAEVTSATLTRGIEALGGASRRARRPDGSLFHQARVRIRVARQEAPVRFRDQLLGFYERFGPGSAGTLSLDGSTLRFEPDAAGEGSALAWALEELRALQTSSSSVQISPGEGGVVLFRFPYDSPRRWDDLLRRALQECWHRLGRGEIFEFQPRIRVR
jgi:hypothetical protein